MQQQGVKGEVVRKVVGMAGAGGASFAKDPKLNDLQSKIPFFIAKKCSRNRSTMRIILGNRCAAK